MPREEKLKKLHELEDALRAYDKRIVEVQAVEYSENANSITLINTHGLKLVNKSNYYTYVGVVAAKEGDQVKSAYDLLFDNDFTRADVKKLAAEIGKKAIDQLGGDAC